MNIDFFMYNFLPLIVHLRHQGCIWERVCVSKSLALSRNILSVNNILSFNTRVL